MSKGSKKGSGKPNGPPPPGVGRDGDYALVDVVIPGEPEPLNTIERMELYFAQKEAAKARAEETGAKAKKKPGKPRKPNKD